MAPVTPATMPPKVDGGQLLITQVKSAIGNKPKHRGTLRALGLHGIGSANTLPDRPEIRGMIARVPHLITVQAGGDASNDKPKRFGRGAQAPASTNEES